VRNTADMVVQFEYGEDGIDPSRSVQGKPIDVDDLLLDVLGDEAEILAKIEEKKIGGYAMIEKDLMELGDEDAFEEPDFDGGED